ncbi:16S rRNA (guanine(527)-N(7))-methyltransferase RsmG [Novosphingobium flavum]|uniref:Ribosomal RNA small subunit methyltransferase G n=1 Tax=Novosphingobium flavum TaxID=1778672 RepID=A0A7X1FPE1_9SPHN|nr:16S rRNA (guanine(527)-N(7))-methyltransferase RsmG [Novosphingobium flavum]MBC2664536.1 16S rRNA (guanine(527)-N(7))-methyltransferase RsmG [Novosphingobium flavum]
MITSEAEARAWIAARPEGDCVALERLERLAALLAEENLRQNLVSAASLPQTWQRHFADSAQLLAHVPTAQAGPWLDLGTGAGFPGLVIAVLQPEREIVMVESRARRVEWLSRAAETLGLAKARVIGKRLELVESFPAAAISARAFAPLDRLLELSARFSTSDTIWLLPKGRSARDEVNRLTGWNHLFHVEQSLTDAEAGIVVGTLPGSNKKARTR